MPSDLAVLAVDDELPALEDLLRVLRASPLTGRVEGVTSARDALLRIGSSDWDALFLDVRMPGLDGMQLARVLRRLAHAPQLVFVSAYETGAVEAFELQAVDYVLKPAGRDRVDAALQRVVTAIETAPAPTPAAAEPAVAADADMIAVDSPRGGATRLLARSSILYLQAHGDYVRVVADDGRFLLRARLGDLEERWAAAGFVRVHRAFVANLARATELRPRLNGTAVLRFGDAAEIPISRRQIAELRRRLAL
ncbi:MAG TPA: LytTR family DNA-binding domain-containing protein [Solirubrobacteraceae bacterium]